MTANSFSFGGFNSYDDWGIKTIAYDVFAPPKRGRKLHIPHTSGMYDYGSAYYDERVLSIECHLVRQLTKAEFRRIVYELSKKRQIRLYNEPEKYYAGELYESPEVDVWAREVRREFTLNFICEPFAYKDMTTASITSGANPFVYEGTAPAPALIVIKNNGGTAVSNIVLTVISRK